MFHARAWAAAVPPAAWTAVAGLVLLASVGLALVVGAGLSVWRGAVVGRAAPPAVVIEPPRSGLIVVSPPAAPPRPHATVPTTPPGKVRSAAVPAKTPTAPPHSAGSRPTPPTPPAPPSKATAASTMSVPRASAVARERSNGRPSANGKHWKQDSAQHR